MNRKHKIAIISDTHGQLRPEMLDWVKTCDAVLHAGDVGKQRQLEELRSITKVYAVRGNTDRGLAKILPEELEVTLFGFRFYIVHDKKQIRSNLDGIDVVVYGHSHKYEKNYERGIFYLNPGSCGPKRFHLPVTMAVLDINAADKQIEISRIDLLKGDVNHTAGLTARDIQKIVADVVREMKAGNTIEQMALKYGIPKELAEQICRIYVTHPGVSVQGIIDKMEVSALFEK